MLSFIFGFVSYPISYIPSNNDGDFTVKTGIFSENSIVINDKEEKITLSEGTKFDDGQLILEDTAELSFNDITHGWFNYYGITYTADAHLKGTLNYRCGAVKRSENFFLEPGENVSFYSFINNMLSGTKANGIYSLTFEALSSDKALLEIHGLALFNREIPDKYVYIQNDTYKIGVNLLWGGALSYLEDLNSNVEAVEVDGRVFVDSNAGERYGAKVVNKNVNLINRFDPGRLVQQSYYGSTGGDYESGIYMGNVWAYNPVQGGNQFGDNSKIVDLRCDYESIYIKCQPLDWAKEKEHITPSYMEATYKIENNNVKVSCRFIDFSGREPLARDQEIPAFYCIEPFNRFIYYGGDKPWTNDTLSVEPDLIFWPDAGYPKFTSLENWAAFIGEFDDSFGIGVYVPGETDFLTGVFARETTSNHDPSIDAPTSYIAVIRVMSINTFNPFEYSYYLTTGTADEMRNNFREIAE